MSDRSHLNALRAGNEIPHWGHKDYCAFECIFTASTKYAHDQEIIDAYDQALHRKFGSDVRPHWGQMMRDPDSAEIHSMYPRYDRWRAIRDELDPQRLFLNEWQKKRGGAISEPIE
jgi:FAD/FMN-containing dehydrogenase